MSIRKQSEPGRLAAFGIVSVALLAVIIVFVSQQIDSAQSASTGAAMSMSVTSSNVALNGTFDVIVSADTIPAAGYVGIQAWIQYGATGLTCNGPTMLWTGSPNGNDGVVATLLSGNTGTGCSAAGLTGLIGPQPSNLKGDIYSFSFTCTSGDSSHVLVLEPYQGPNAGNGGSGYTDESLNITSAVPGPDLPINCGAGAPVDTPTPSGPGAQPTATA